MNAKVGKIALAVVLFIVAIGVFWFYVRTPSVLPSSVRFVCVATGARFSIAQSDLRMFPAKNPKTKELTLLPIYEEDGKFLVASRYGDYVRDPNLLGKVNKYVDPKTLEVLSSPRP